MQSQKYFLHIKVDLTINYIRFESWRRKALFPEGPINNKKVFWKADKLDQSRIFWSSLFLFNTDEVKEKLLK